MKKILIVEDDRWLAENYQLLFQKNGWQVALTGQAAEAMDIIDEFKPDVILLDFILPEKNAPTLLNELQSHPDTANIPIAVCTSLSKEKLNNAVLDLYGVRVVVDKATVTPEEMLNVMNGLLPHATT